MRAPVTLRHIAAACGLHTSTISLALKNAPSIPLPTRLRIHAAAAKLGYRPNIGARNLALLRLDKNTTGALPIAWINQEPERHHWRTDVAARRYYDAARRRAEASGYRLDPIWAREPGMTPTRLMQVLRARGITGALLPVHRHSDASLLSVNWSDFAVVGFNDLQLGEHIDVVCPNHHANTTLALRHLRQLGFVRCGLVLSAHLDAATQGTIHGCYLRHQIETAPSERVPVCLAPSATEQHLSAVDRWLHQHRPDVVLCRDALTAARVRAAHLPAVGLQLDDSPSAFDAGIVEGTADIAALAIDVVCEKMRRFDYDVRPLTRLLLRKGAWHEASLNALHPEAVVA